MTSRTLIDQRAIEAAPGGGDARGLVELIDALCVIHALAAEIADEDVEKGGMARRDDDPPAVSVGLAPTGENDVRAIAAVRLERDEDGAFHATLLTKEDL